MRRSTFTPEGRPSPATAFVFDSLSEVSAFISAGVDVVRSSWGLTRLARERLLTGDASLVDRSSALLDRIEAASPLADVRVETVRVVAGGAADVPAYLAGSPVAMRQRRRRSAPAPLRIVVDVTSSASVDDATLERRGVATLALLRLLEAAGHAVELWIAHGIGEGSQTGLTLVRLDTQPLDLARAVWALASSQASRECLFTTSNSAAECAAGGWPWQNVRWNGHPAVQRSVWASVLGVDPGNVLLLPGVFTRDGATPYTSDAQAAQWVASTYAEAVSPAPEAVA